MKRGCVVVSSAGKDSGCIMAVLRAEPGALWVSDGRKRPVQRPKRKNPRHVTALECQVDEASMATNRELRRALAAIRSHADRPEPTGGQLPGHRQEPHMREVI